MALDLSNIPAQTIVNAILVGGLLITGISYGYSSLVKGKGDRTKTDLENENSLTTYMKNQIDGFKSMVDQQNLKIIEMGKEIAVLKATLDEKDKIIAEYLSIMRGTNPEMITFMKHMTQAAEDQARFRINAEKTFSEITISLTDIHHGYMSIQPLLEKFMDKIMAPPVVPTEMKIEGKLTSK